MDDVQTLWLRLALCRNTPPALLHELSGTPPDNLDSLNQRLAAWFDGEQATPQLDLAFVDHAGGEPADTSTAPNPNADSHANPWRALKRRLLAKPVTTAIEQARQWQAAHPTHHLITPDHRFWPDRLRSLPDSPALLYALGDPAVLGLDQIGIVGARRASVDGQISARHLACELATEGWVITSGLAKGIDTESHLSCLAAIRPTVAVMATDAASIYPKINRPLAERIVAEGGCLITETPLGQPLTRYRFPLRNRLISALSRGVIVVEAAQKSGTITTAYHAAAQGREVMAVPGSIRNPNVAGCHQLIRDGATLITNAADVVECVGRCHNTAAAHNSNPAASEAGPETDSDQVATLLQAMGYDAAPLARLALHTGLDAAELVTLLMQLELQGRISRDSAGRYSRC